VESYKVSGYITLYKHWIGSHSPSLASNQQLHQLYTLLYLTERSKQHRQTPET